MTPSRFTIRERLLMLLVVFLLALGSAVRYWRLKREASHPASAPPIIRSNSHSAEE